MPEDPPTSPIHRPPPPDNPWAQEFCEMLEISNHFQFERLLSLSFEEQSRIQDVVSRLIQAILERDLSQTQGLLDILFECFRNTVLWPIPTGIDTSRYEGEVEYHGRFSDFKKLFQECYRGIREHLRETRKSTIQIVPPCVTNLGLQITDFITHFVPKDKRNSNPLIQPQVGIGPRVKRTWYGDVNHGQEQRTGIRFHGGGIFNSLQIPVNGSDVSKLLEHVRETVGKNIHAEAMERGCCIVVAVLPEHAEDVRRQLEQQVCGKVRDRTDELLEFHKKLSYQ